MSTRWTPEQDKLLVEIYSSSSKKDILEKLNKDWFCIRRRASRLKLHRDKKFIDEDRKIRYKVRSDSYTEQEKNLLKQIYENNTKKFILDEFEKAGFDRSWQSIALTARSINLKRNPEIVKQEMIEAGSNAPTPGNIILWTEDDDIKLRSTYLTGSQEEIMALFHGRTWKALREHATRLGLARSKEVIDKDRAKHLMENLGVKSTWQLPKVKEASRQTNLEKRGVEYPTQSPVVWQKVMDTVQKKYGVKNVFQSKEIQKKSRQTLYQDGTQQCSKQQRYIANLLNGEINYPIGNCSADILINEKTICEYDGGGHYISIKMGLLSAEDFKKSERKRDFFIKSQGFSIIRIISKEDLLPEDTVLLRMISEAKEHINDGNNQIMFDIDQRKIFIQDIPMEYNYGDLRRI